MKIKKLGSIFLLALLLVACSNNKPTKAGNKKVKEVKTKIEAAFERTQKKPLDNAYSLLNGKDYPKVENNFGAEVAYLQPVNDTKSEDFFEKYDEAKALEFFKNREVKGYGSNSPYWRWKASISKAVWFQKIAERLPQISNRNRKNVFVLENGVWVNNLPIHSVGSVTNIKVMSRGASGVITHLLVETTKGSYLVTKEYNIRRLLATNGNIYGARYGEDYSAKSINSGSSLFPSASIAFDLSSSTVTIYGGGYGHSSGMMQYGAGDMAKNYGFSYKKILNHYYQNIKIEDIEDVIGKNHKIKVGITHGSNGNLDHSNLIIHSHGKLRVFGEDGFDYSYPAGTEIKLVAKAGKVRIMVGGSDFSSKQAFYIDGHGEFLTVKGLRKAHTSNPKYRGRFMIVPKGNSMHLISVVDVEDYLKQVVPSEMPRSFGVEALKVQAVAARTYALSDYLKGRYENLGFHVKDTVESQVYNNQVENEDANQAIAATKGEVMTYEGKPIDAKYASTSAGFTEAAHRIW